MARKAVFLDRDDTIISDPGYISHPTQVKLLPGAGASLTLLQKMGYLLVVVTNQSGIARGIITEQGLEEIHHHLKKLLADEGVYLDAIYHCPFHPEGTVEQYAKDSDLRKPSPGMLLLAAKELDIDLKQSWMIGDSYRDVAAGHRAGCKTILLDTPGKPQPKDPNDPEPDKRAVNLREAVNILRMFEFQKKVQSVRPTPQEPTAASAPLPSAEPKPQIPPAPAPTAKPQQPIAATPAADKAAALPPQTNPQPPAAPVPQPEPVTKPSVGSPKTEHEPAEKNAHPMLEEILHHVKSKSRYELYDEFSVFMLIAWLVQSLAAFSLVISIWFWLDATRGIETVQTMIGYAIALQLLVIALLMMHDRKK